MKFLHLLTCVLLVSACAQTNSGKKTTPVSPEPEPRVIGGQKDAHGCLSAAGYQWSALKKECIRIFEQGTRLDAKARGLDNTLSAFILFKPDDNAQAELFLPGKPEGMLMARAAKNTEATWAVDTITLTQSKGIFTLKGKSGVVLYQGPKQ